MNGNADLLPCVTLKPDRTAGAAVIWLHGLGADGHDFEPVVPLLKLPAEPAVRFVFPHAPRRPVTLNHGMVMRAWYDIPGPERRGDEDEAGIRASAAAINRLIDHEIGLGIPSTRIVLAGFSQGGAIVLQTGLRHSAPLGGIAALSTYLPLASRLPAEAHPANRSIPILMAHGRQDAIIPLSAAARSRDLLRAQGYPLDWHEYDLGHGVSAEVLADLSAWLMRVLAADAGAR